MTLVPARPAGDHANVISCKSCGDLSNCDYETCLPCQIQDGFALYMPPNINMWRETNASATDPILREPTPASEIVHEQKHAPVQSQQAAVSIEETKQSSPPIMTSVTQKEEFTLRDQYVRCHFCDSERHISQMIDSQRCIDCR
jgi:hypothetical protein